MKATPQRGEKAFEFLEGPETRGRFPTRVPLHVINGRTGGPTLLVQAGSNGLEIEPAMVLPHLAEELDPAEISGTLIVAPVLNTSGFEFEQVHAVWDGQDLNTLGRGRANGTVSEQLIYVYFKRVISRADAMIDIRTGARWGYFQYAGVYHAGPIGKSRDLAAALGLPQVLLGQPEDRSPAFKAAQSGKIVVSAWIGGGPGLRDHRADDMRRVRNAVLYAMRHLGMIGGSPTAEPDRVPVTVVRAHTVLRPSGERGLTFMAREKRGTTVKAGERLGYVMHPFTGEIIQEITAPRDGIMLHAGASWPVVPEGCPLAILGDLVEEI